MNLFLILPRIGSYFSHRGICLLLASIAIALLSACASVPPNSEATLPSKTVPDTSIVNQVGGQAAEQQLSQNLQAMLAYISKTEGIPLGSLETAFADSKNLAQVRKLVMPGPPGFKKNWAAYRGRFIEPARIKAGLAFIEQNRPYLDQVERETGVPGTVIASIIGVETIYGRNMGSFKVKDVLSTLAFNYPDTPNRASREALFQDQLKQLILLCWAEAGGNSTRSAKTPSIKTNAFDRCLNQTSSYAGAIGLPQFMPGSIRNFAKDGDGDGVIDLRQSRPDAIASVARFLRMHGWQPGMPIYFPITETEQNQAAIRRLADGLPDAKHTVQEFIDLGILDSRYGDLQTGGVASQSKALIIDLPFINAQGNDEVRYVVGLENFLSIVQYNRSYFYAQSVAEFAEALGYENQSVVPKSPATPTAKTKKSAVKKTQKPKKPKAN
ncbi:lytic murein transglycosylase [Polynucleobacter sp.]|uniref:lytic murein transglycosylase n=1 Tax=Polynucleobacter sp. TaxID=2029855 RepID=UPI00273769AA|nr:lytic murein transglycosylase [Polynucleobacter sp.]MDP3122074.1 lytic murein transglycosylase [Polynucleobacter sp.]